MDTEKRVLSGIAISVFVLLALALVALIVVTLVTLTPEARQQPTATSIDTTGNPETMPAGGYGIRILFSDGEMVSVGGIVPIKPGQIPKEIIFVPVKMTPGVVFQIEKR